MGTATETFLTELESVIAAEIANAAVRAEGGIVSYAESRERQRVLAEMFPTAACEAVAERLLSRLEYVPEEHRTLLRQLIEILE